MAANTLDIRPLSGAIGAEILGIDLAHDRRATRPIAAIRAAWLEHLVIFFRDQTLEPAQFLGARAPLRRAGRISVRERARRISRRSRR